MALVAQQHACAASALLTRVPQCRPLAPTPLAQIFDTCGTTKPANNQYYASAWRCLAAEPMVGSATMVTHSMTFNVSTVRDMLAAIGGGAAWDRFEWVGAIVRCIEDGKQAVLGFSEYWSYASYAIRHAERLGAPPPCVRSSVKCPRVKHGDGSAPGRCDDSSAGLPRDAAYVVYETGASGHAVR